MPKDVRKKTQSFPGDRVEFITEKGPADYADVFAGQTSQISSRF
ncbi:MAG: hypothetical protein R6V15_08655 [Desulfotignum sp.]